MEKDKNIIQTQRNYKSRNIEKWGILFIAIGILGGIFWSPLGILFLVGFLFWLYSRFIA